MSDYSITNREYLKDAIHDIHNFLRNNGAGYGMNALKIFNLFYGLKKIEDYGLYEKYTFKCGLCDDCIEQRQCNTARFSNILKVIEKLDDKNFIKNIIKYYSDDNKRKILSDTSIFLARYIYVSVLSSIDNDDIEKDLHELIFYEIPKNLSSNLFKKLLIDINNIGNIEKKYNVQLSGKIYEYFIGRDQSAISELGAYFTDRHIVNSLFKFVNEYVYLDSNNSINSFIDPFGGSGGFTTAFIQHINEKYNDIIDWSKDIQNLYHCDLSEDVIKSAGLEILCLTHQIPNFETNVLRMNTFEHEFVDKNIQQKFKYIFTNPPYGGDKSSQTQEMIKQNKTIEYIQKYIQENDIDDELEHSLCIQIQQLKKAIKEDKDKMEQSKVKVSNSSQRIQKYAEKFGLKGNDKEASSLILFMELLDKDGLCVGVLKEGVFFDKKYKDIRKTLLKEFNVEAVISIPNDAFENTTTKTSALIFRNTTQKTKSVKFYNLNVPKYENDIFELIDNKFILIQNSGDIIDKDVKPQLYLEVDVKYLLEQPKISFVGKDYKDIVQQSENYSNVELTDSEDEKENNVDKVLLKDLAIIKSGNHTTKKSDFNPNGEYLVVGGGLKPSGKHDKYNCKENTIICSGAGTPGLISIYPNKTFLTVSFSIEEDNTKINKLYLYNYLKIKEKYLSSLSIGTTQKGLNINILNNIKIPILKDKTKMEYYIKGFEKYNKDLQELEETIKSDEQKIYELIENETDFTETKLDSIFKLEKTTKHYSSIGKEKGLYRLYCSSQDKKLYVDFCEINTLSIILGQGGSFNVHLDKNFTPSKHVCVINCKDNTNINKLIYLYYLFKNNKIVINSNGSTISWTNKETIKNLNINFPNNNSILKLIEIHDNILTSKNKLEDLKKNNILNEFNNEFK